MKKVYQLVFQSLRDMLIFLRAHGVFSDFFCLTRHGSKLLVIEPLLAPLLGEDGAFVVYSVRSELCSGLYVLDDDWNLKKVKGKAPQPGLPVVAIIEMAENQLADELLNPSEATGSCQ